MRTIFTEIQQFVNEYEDGSINLIDGLEFNQGQKLREIEFYSNSKYLNGDTDELDREKPFFNIVNANVDVAVVATDIDTKDISIQSPSRQGYGKSFVLRKEVGKWMRSRKVNFAETLNDMGETRARYGGVLVKKCEEDGELRIDVIVWKNSVTNPENISKGTKVERHWMTALDLMKKRGVWEDDAIDEALEMCRKAKKNGYKVEVLEIEGEFAKSCYTEDESDDDDYSLQCYYLIADAKHEIVLYSEELKESRYKYLPWKKRPSNPEGLGIGVVEEGMQAQIWTNDSVLMERNIMDLAGKAVPWTDDPKLEGRNTITEIDNGTMISVQQGRKVGLLNLTPQSLPQFQTLIERWQKQYDRAVAITDSLRGETPPSGQAYRTNALITQQSGSQFDYRRESMGTFIKEVFTDWVIPHLKKKLKKAHQFPAELSKEEMDEVDDAYINFKIFEQLEPLVKAKKLVNPLEIEMAKQQLKQKLMQTKSHRYLDVPDGYYDDLEVEVDIITTGEQKNKMATLDSLSSILDKVMASYNPQTGKFAVLDDPVLSEIFYQIVETAGIDISPVSLAAQQKKQSIQMMPTATGGKPTAQPTPNDSSLPDPNQVGPAATTGQ
jgi:hypothetical protein